MDMKNRVLLISNMYPSPKYPHYGVFVENSVKILAESGYIVDIVSLEKEDNKLIKLLHYAKFYIEAIYKIIFLPYDVIYAHYASHTALPILIGKKIKRNIKLIVNVHGNDVVPEDAHDEKFMDLVKKLLNISDRVICPSLYFKKTVIDDFDVSPDKIDIYPSGGIDTDFFCQMPKEIARKELNLPNDCKYIGFVSRLEKDKGWDIFLEMAHQIRLLRKNVKFIVVGDGAEAKEYEKKEEELGVKDEIIKFPLLPKSKLKLIYNALDIFVFPTYRKSESLGLVGLEAMACETLVILPDRYGPTSYEQDMKNSIVFESANSVDLTKKILRALDMDPIALQKGARKTAECFSNTSTNGILIDIFQKTLK